jgi:penicillin-binding protein 2
MASLRYAGKTGTAQVVRRKDDNEEATDDDDIPYQYRDHALFVSFAPAEKPQIAVAVVIEHGGHGSSAAAPVAKAIYEAYFADQVNGAATPQPVASGD